MADLRLDAIAKKTGGRILQGDPGRMFRGFSIDSRNLAAGDLFFAIVANRDGHDFIDHARRNGAAAAVVSRDVLVSDPGFGLIRVKDTIQALQRLGRSVLEDTKAKIVGITGSAGKTTTKEFTAAILGRKFRVMKSEKNLNNHLGLALSLLRISPDDAVAVLEMAMSGPGEIRTLTRIAPPDVAVVTNVNPVHLQFFNGLEDIARAKKEILEGTKSGGTAVLNADDPLVRDMAADWKGTTLFFGMSPRADVRAANIRKSGYEGMTFDLIMNGQRRETVFPFFTQSNVENFLAAAGAAGALGLTIDDAAVTAAKLKPFPGRGALLNLKRAVRLIDDTYNSNPRALESALRDLADLPSRRRIAVLGDMLELGKDEISFHVRAGRQAAEEGWNLLITVGPLSRNMADGAKAGGMDRSQILSFEDSEKAAAAVPQLLGEDDLVLVKASRGMKTEKIVEAIIKTFGEA